jgi:outer membrane immunogenic protein
MEQTLPLFPFTLRQFRVWGVLGMRSTLLASAALIAVSSSAYAADVIVYQDPIFSPQPIAQFNWTGFYAGVNAGYGGGTFKHPFALAGRDTPSAAFETFLSGSLDITAGGGVAGGQVGYNQQFGNWVAGVEADLQWSGIKGELSGVINSGGDSANFALGTEVDWFGTVRGRLGGLVTDRFMVYATGGLAYGRVASYYNIAADDFGFGTDSGSVSDTSWGWTIGAGAEYAFTDRLSLKTEYLYTDLGKRNVLTAGGGVEDPLFTIDNDVKFHTVRAGLNYHF